jgi:hypothetical protein
LIDACGNRAVSVVGRFYFWEGVYQTRARIPKKYTPKKAHHKPLPPRSILGGFRSPKWQNRSKKVD